MPDRYLTTHELRIAYWRGRADQCVKDKTDLHVTSAEFNELRELEVDHIRQESLRFSAIDDPPAYMIEDLPAWYSTQAGRVKVVVDFGPEDLVVTALTGSRRYDGVWHQRRPSFPMTRPDGSSFEIKMVPTGHRVERDVGVTAEVYVPESFLNFYKKIFMHWIEHIVYDSEVHRRLDPG